MHVISVLFWITSKRAKEALKRPQDPPKGTPTASKRPPRPPQEAAKCFRMALRAAPDPLKTLKIAKIAEIDKA